VSIVAEQLVKVPVSAGLAEEVERQEREDDARGPEPDDVVTRTVLPGVLGEAGVSPTPLPSVVPGADEVRVRMLLCRVLGVVA
jgi:hypothetical protein